MPDEPNELMPIETVSDPQPQPAPVAATVAESAPETLTSLELEEGMTVKKDGLEMLIKGLQKNIPDGFTLVQFTVGNDPDLERWHGKNDETFELIDRAS